ATPKKSRRSAKSPASAISMLIPPRKFSWTSRIFRFSGFGPAEPTSSLDLKPEEFLTDLSDADALVEAAQGAVEHMNTDHQEALGLYATRLLGAAAADWRCSGIDPEGIDLQADNRTLRLDFPERVIGPGELRKMLVRLADEA